MKKPTTLLAGCLLGTILVLAIAARFSSNTAPESVTGERYEFHSTRGGADFGGTVRAVNGHWVKVERKTTSGSPEYTRVRWVNLKQITFIVPTSEMERESSF
jgi:hypothetical protein